MQSSTTRSRTLQLRPVPLALGAFFSAVTAFVLFDDVRHGAEFTTSHVLSLAALVAALASGHFALPQFRARSIPSALTLVVLFLGATSYVVISSGARNAEVAQAKAAAALDTNAKRAHELSRLAEAETMLADAQRSHGAECRTGKGKRCDGIAATVAVYAAAVKGHQATLAELGPERRPDAGYAHAGQVLAALPFVTADAGDIAARLSLLLPFLVVLISELGTIVFVHIGIGSATMSTRKSTADSSQTSFPDNVGGVDPRWFSALDAPEPPNGGPSGPNGGQRVRTSLPANVVPLRQVHPVIAALESVGGGVGSNKELAKLMGVTDPESTKRVREVRHLLDFERVGKELRISLKSKAARAA